MPGRGWIRHCACGLTFSSWSWQHVPKFYDHLATRGESV